MTVADAALNQASKTVVRLWRLPFVAGHVARTADIIIKWEKLYRNTRGRLTTRSDGHTVTWHESGRGDALVLLNGFTGSGLSWPSSFVRHLEQRFRVIRIDNRGTGWARDVTGAFTMADMADDVRDALDALGVETAVVFGHSMGGMIAQEFALRHPGRVKHLVLASTIPPAPAFIPTAGGMTQATILLKPPAADIENPTEEQMHHASRQWLQFAAHGFEPQIEVLHEMGHQALMRVTPFNGIMLQARAIYAWRNPRRLRKVSVPTTVMHGLADHIVPPVNSRRIADLIPGAKLIEVPGAGHLFAWEAHDAIVDVLDPLATEQVPIESP